MDAKKIFFIAVAVSLSSVESFSLQQLKDGEVYARDCIIKVGINPLAVSRLVKGDFSRNDEKIQVSFVEKSFLKEIDQTMLLKFEKV